MSNNTQLLQLINNNIPTLERYIDFQKTTSKVGIYHLFCDDEERYIREKHLECIESLSKFKEGNTDALDEIQEVFQDIKEYITEVTDREEKNQKEKHQELLNIEEDIMNLEKSLDILYAINSGWRRDIEIANHHLSKAKDAMQEELEELDEMLMEESIEDAVYDLRAEFYSFEAYLENLKIELENALNQPIEQNQKLITFTEQDLSELESKVIADLIASEEWKRLVLDFVNAIMNKQ